MRALGMAVAVVVLFVLSVLGVNAALATGPEESSRDVAGCVIRLYESGPRMHVDRTHTCPFVDGVDVAADGALVIRRKHAESIQAAVVSVDETLTARGILAGASWARSATTIRFHDTASHTTLRADDPRLTGPTANIWVLWVS